MPAMDADPETHRDVQAKAAIANVLSRGAIVLVAGILVWGFNRIDRSLDQLNQSLKQVEIAIGRLETERDGVRDRLRSLEARISNQERGERHGQP
ncbi:hypothetical protein [Desertibaculum subflavum]|uniref:hypothetical protein n=1 Tax=Desertibaculum subflavum TaxID=2268458 RepID=UPI0013C46675